MRGFALRMMDERLRRLGIAQVAKHFNQGADLFDKFFGGTMSRGKLYEYAVIYHPKQEKDKPAKRSSLLGDINRVLALSDSEVSILAARSIPEEHLGHLEEIEIVVRPF